MESIRFLPLCIVYSFPHSSIVEMSYEGIVSKKLKVSGQRITRYHSRLMWLNSFPKVTNEYNLNILCSD